MRLRSGFLSFASALLLGGIALTQCRIDDNADDRAWPCVDASECGNQDGQPMACWRGFCVPTCTPLPEPDNRGFVCVETGDPALREGVRLEKCTPTPAKRSGHEGCAPGFECYRTDLIFDLGICVPFNVCSGKSECLGQERTVCASSILEDRLRNSVADAAGGASGTEVSETPPSGAGGSGSTSFVRTDHLLCVSKAPCSDPESLRCPTGEECLGKTYNLESYGLEDFCVPLCDAWDRCPPNFACATTEFAAAANPLCVPGLPGVRCMHDIDCLVGSCEDTQAGFKVCTIPCETQADCTYLNSPPTRFYCVGATPESQKLCLNISPFQGVQCTANIHSTCPFETPRCFEMSPYGVETSKPECRIPCDEDNPCPRRGGLGHVCLAGGEGGCYPGAFGLPCNDSSECLPGLSCGAVEPTGREVLPGSRICSVACRTDEDCATDSALSAPAYCEGEVCRLSAKEGKPCVVGEHCLSGVCGDDDRCTAEP